MPLLNPHEFISYLMPQIESVAKLALERQAEARTHYKHKSDWNSVAHELGAESRVGVVSGMDQEIQENLYRVIRERWPFVNILAEEQLDGQLPYRPGEPNCVLIDPIDGTKSYLEGGKEFCHIASLINGHQIVATLIYAHAYKRLFVAERGNGVRAYSPEGEPEELRITPSAGNVLLHHVARIPPKLLANLRAHGYSIHTSSQNATDILAMFGGDIAGFVSVRPVVHDVWSPGMLVEEAGGAVTDWFGKSPCFTGNYRVPHLLVTRSRHDAERLLPLLETYANELSPNEALR